MANGECPHPDAYLGEPVGTTVIDGRTYNVYRCGLCGSTVYKPA